MSSGPFRQRWRQVRGDHLALPKLAARQRHNQSRAGSETRSCARTNQQLRTGAEHARAELAVCAVNANGWLRASSAAQKLEAQADELETELESEL